MHIVMFGAISFIFVVIFVAVVIITTVSGFVRMSKVNSTRNRIFNVAEQILDQVSNNMEQVQGGQHSSSKQKKIWRPRYLDLPTLWRLS